MCVCTVVFYKSVFCKAFFQKQKNLNAYNFKRVLFWKHIFQRTFLGLLHPPRMSFISHPVYLTSQQALIVQFEMELSSKEFFLRSGMGQKGNDYGDKEQDESKFLLFLFSIFSYFCKTRSPAALRAPTFRWRPFGPLDFVLRAHRALRPCDPHVGDRRVC